MSEFDSEFDRAFSAASATMFDCFGVEARCRYKAGDYFVRRVDILRDIQAFTADGYVQGVETHIELLHAPSDFGVDGLVYHGGECWRLVRRISFDADVVRWLVAPVSDHDLEVADQLMPNLNEAINRGW